MPNYNRCEFIGTLGRDAETRFSKDAHPILNLSLATKYRDKTTWIRVTAFNKTAEWNAHLKKGAHVWVEGPMSMEEWTGKDGAKRTTLCMVANTIQEVAWAKRDAAASTGETGRATAAATNEPAISDDDVPF